MRYCFTTYDGKLVTPVSECTGKEISGGRYNLFTSEDKHRLDAIAQSLEKSDKIIESVVEQKIPDGKVLKQIRDLYNSKQYLKAKELFMAEVNTEVCCLGIIQTYLEKHSELIAE